jgi:hypothetical protein
MELTANVCDALVELLKRKAVATETAVATLAKQRDAPKSHSTEFVCSRREGHLE